MARIYLMAPTKGWYHPDLPAGWKEVIWLRFNYVECGVYKKDGELTMEDKSWVEDYSEVPEEWPICLLDFIPDSYRQANKFGYFVRRGKRTGYFINS